MHFQALMGKPMKHKRSMKQGFLVLVLWGFLNKFALQGAFLKATSSFLHFILLFTSVWF